VNLPVEYQVGVADHVVVAVVLRDPEPRPAGLETGLRQIAGERFAVGIQRQFKRRHFIADAFAQGFDAGDLAEYRVLRPVGLPVPGDEPAVAQQHIADAVRELDLAQSDKADRFHQAASSSANSSRISRSTAIDQLHSPPGTTPPSIALA